MDHVELIKERAYRVLPIIEETTDRKIQKTMQDGIVEQPLFAWSSPVIIVPKNNGQYRFCVNFRKIDKITKLIVDVTKRIGQH